MIKTPIEHRVAQEVLEECFPVYLVHFPEGASLDCCAKDELHILIKGFVIGRGYDWTSIVFADIQELLYQMAVTLIERRIVKHTDSDYAWLHHVRKQFEPAHPK